MEKCLGTSNPRRPPPVGNRPSEESYRSAEEFGANTQEPREENEVLRQRIRELEWHNEGLINELQGRGTVKHREPHEAISGEFNDVFQQCRRWASAYFEIEIAGFDIKKFREFEKEVGLISFVDFESIKRKECFNVSHLVQGVLGNILAVEIFQSPFQGCANEFRDEFSRHYRFMLDSRVSTATRGVFGADGRHQWRTDRKRTAGERDPLLRTTGARIGL